MFDTSRARVLLRSCIASIIGLLVAGTLTASGQQGLAEQRGFSLQDGTVQLVLDGDSLDWATMTQVLQADSVRISLADEARQQMTETRTGALSLLRSGKRVYGWNQALGPLKDKPLTIGQQRDFQRRVLLSHAAGTGPTLSPGVARLALVLRVNSMARGAMGVRPELADRILSLVNAGITPDMPEIGSTGIGDLQPMAAAGLTMVGQDNPAMLRGERMRPEQALRQAGLASTFQLESGEALPLISGNSVVTAKLVRATVRAQRSLAGFDGAFALFLEATRAEQGAFDPRTHAERGIPNENAAAKRTRALICGTQWMTEKGRRQAGESAPRVQDAVSVRGASHVLGALRDTIAETKGVAKREANASTSNPLVFEKDNGHYEFVMGGNWNGAKLGQSADRLNAQLVDLGGLSEQLSGRLLDEGWSYGLPASLAGGTPGLNTGLAMTHPVAAALVSEMQVVATPAGTLSRPTMGGQEDDTSMAMTSVRNLTANLDRLQTIIGIQLILGAQGMDLIKSKMGELEPGKGSAAVLRLVRERISPVSDDRYLTPDVDKATELAGDRRLSDTVISAATRGCGD
ncbi:histidine ammonia-lyase [Tamaricihabitans halophyticus]|uniref:Histidine ammonia-lyase n=1 Tax=Tamaricihabitans halophyticus TaxID=1262583 RepID=A0A4R2Q766_9PSEU|nr:aromatic amino acid ammonia-lyase [Tamaricihabitans halophyticus]TCP42621.1 histidine ammonia-lyase [Tamaricihabitans halophyticus]